MFPVNGNGNERDELAGRFIDDDEAGVFAARLAGNDRGRRNSDERDGDCGDRCADCQRGGCWLEDVRRSVPEQQGGYRAVGSRARFQKTGAEERAHCPCPEGLLLGGRMKLFGGVRH